MARPTAASRRLQELLARHSPKVRAAFLRGVAELQRGVDQSALVAALEAQDVTAALRALHVDNAAFADLAQAMRAAYTASGQQAAADFPLPPASSGIARPMVRFDAANVAAEARIARLAGDLITRVSRDTIESARGLILDGFAQGQHPHAISRAIVGKFDTARQMRTGGILGLSQPFTAHVRSMRARLASADPAEIAKVLGMTRRDRRFDARLRTAISGDKALTARDIETMTARYADRLLDLRGKTIARTETGAAVMGARAEAWQQGLDKTDATEADVTRTWLHGGGGEHPREDHEEMDGTQVQGLTASYMLPDGSVMMHPLDMAGGPENVINCTCYELVEIDYAAVARRREMALAA